jgi:hypothetical protein
MSPPTNNWGYSRVSQSFIYLSIIFPNNVILSTIDIWFVYQDTYFVSCSLPLLPSIWFVFLGMNVIDCIKAVDGEVRVPRVDSLKRHILKRFQKVNSFESSILKNLSEKVSILYPNIDGVSNPCNCREKGITNKDFLSKLFLKGLSEC